MGCLSAFAPFIIGLIEQKRSLGYKWESEPDVLRRFESFCMERHPHAATITQEVMLDWAAKRPNEKPATLQNRLTPVRELAKYMVRLGYDVYLMPKGLMPRTPKYMPHIYTNDELRCIFEQTDKCHYCIIVPFRHLVMPEFFRLLYCTGMRLSEARLLRVRDVDLANGVITVTNAKLDKYRQLPLSQGMLERLQKYHANVHVLSKPDDLFFPGYNGKSMTRGNVEKISASFCGRHGFRMAGGAKVREFMISGIPMLCIAFGDGYLKERT